MGSARRLGGGGRRMRDSPAGDPSVEDILAALSADGGRTTVQRRIVVSALLSGPRHVTAEDLASPGRARHPDIATSPIYRTLDALDRQGAVPHAQLAHG